MKNWHKIYAIVPMIVAWFWVKYAGWPFLDSSLIISLLFYFMFFGLGLLSYSQFNKTNSVKHRVYLYLLIGCLVSVAISLSMLALFWFLAYNDSH